MNKKVTALAFLAVTMGFLYYCYEYLLRISPSVMQDDLMRYFSINATLFGTFSAFYYYAYTPMQLAVGIMVDKYDVKKVLFFATILCAIGTTMISYSDSYVVAAAGRFLQGFASAFAWVSILKLGVIFLPRQWLGFVSGIGSSFGFLGAAAGQVAMGYVVQHLGWTVVLQALSVMGVPLAFLIFMVIKRAEIKLVEARQHVLYKSANISLKGWFIRFLIVARKKQVWQAGFIAALLFLPTAVFAELWGVEYMGKIYGFSKTGASSVTAMIFIGWAIGSVIVGLTSVIIHKRLVLMRVGMLFALIMSIVLLYMHLPLVILYLSCMLFGIFSAVQVLTFPMGMEVVSPRIAGIAGAFVNFLCMLSGMIFQRVAGQILDWSWNGTLAANGTRAYSIYDYKLAVCIIPASLLICLVFTCFLKEKKKLVRTISI
jgi:MFS family permease